MTELTSFQAKASKLQLAKDQLGKDQLVNNHQIQDIHINNTVYDINNLLVTIFKNNNIQIFGTWDNPLFKANDIGALLGIKDMRTSLRILNEDDQHAMPVIDSIGRNQEMLMLSESGLYKVLFKSRKQVAQDFQNHVCDLLKQQRLELGKQLANQHKWYLFLFGKISI